MKKKHVFQIKSKKDAQYLAKKIKNSSQEFYFHVPLVGGMEGSFMTIRCDAASDICSIYSSIPGSGNQEEKVITEVVDYLWKERKLINAELRNPDSEWYRSFPRARAY